MESPDVTSVTRAIRRILCDDDRVRRLLVSVLALTFVVLAPLAAGAAPPPTAPPVTEPPVTLANGKSLTECISANPPPGCSTRRETDGHQVAVLAVLAGGVAFIGWRVARGVRQRDRAAGTAVR